LGNGRDQNHPQKNAIASLENIWKNWKALEKNKKRKSDPQGKRKVFLENLDKLWDIGSKDAISVIQNNRLLTSQKKEDDKNFYRDQQGPRVASMSGRDKIFAKKLQRNICRTTTMIASNPCSDNSGSNTEDVLSESSFSEFDDTDSNSEERFLATTSKASPTVNYVMLRAPRNLMENAEVTKTVDRLKISDNAATMLLAAFIKACEGDISQFVLSRSSTRRARTSTRLQIHHSIMKEVINNPPENIALHWDGKLTEDRLGQKFEALSVVVSSVPRFTNGKVLGIQKIYNASGQSQAEAYYNLLKEWNLDDKVKALVFDTTSSNTGWKQGAAKLLEELMQRKVLYHACRHHVFELVLKSVWKCLYGKTTTGPESPWFNNFKQNWTNINKTKPFRVLHVPSGLEERASLVVEDLKELMKSKSAFVRDDYKQCASNTLALLGATPQECVTHHKPGATHHARWMGTVLYCQKMLMWADQMSYSSAQISLLERMNVFLALFYVPIWLKSHESAEAGINDLMFIHDLIDYKSTDAVVATAALQKMLRHPWYLVEETVVYALFSETERFSEDEKAAMAKKILTTTWPNDFRTGPPVLAENIERNTSLTDLVGPQSWHIFAALGNDFHWLEKPPNEWQRNEAFQQTKAFVRTVKVINDAAERGVKLNTDYAQIITDSEEQKKSLIQAVESHRRNYPDFRKSTLQ